MTLYSLKYLQDVENINLINITSTKFGSLKKMISIR